MTRPLPSVIFLFILASLLLVGCGTNAKEQWRTAQVEKGILKVEVTATGTLNPHFLVEVGTQVSGTLAHIFVDYNSRVKKGQLIALIDTTFLNAAVKDARATLAKASAQETLMVNSARRLGELFERGLASQADLEKAHADQAAAAASKSSAQAQLDRAKINLAYAFITSPITGVVVNRNVDIGQTVAASFNTPTLFTIADDLSRMQVQASIDEADIGAISEGQTAQFTVDAYPDRTFTGMVTQVRLQPVTVQNVVTYTVMIDVDNPDLSLLPGMTANISIVVNEARDVLMVPPAALRFSPPSKASADAGPNGRTQKDTTNVMHENSSRIYVLRDGKPVAVPVTAGLSNGSAVAVTGDLKPGQTVVVGINRAARQRSQQRSPFIPSRGHGRGR